MDIQIPQSSRDDDLLPVASSPAEQQIQADIQTSQNLRDADSLPATHYAVPLENLHTFDGKSLNCSPLFIKWCVRQSHYTFSLQIMTESQMKCGKIS